MTPDDNEMTGMTPGDVTPGDVRAGDVRAGDVRAGDVRAGDVSAEDVVQSQSYALPPTTGQSIGANALDLEDLVMHFGAVRAVDGVSLSLRKGQVMARVADELGRVGLRSEVARRYPHELSGGQRQRVSIARSLVSSPSLLVADEPTSALDVSVQASVLDLLADLQRDIGFACLFITHDLSAVEYLADDVAVMHLSQLVEKGSRARIFAHPAHPYTQALLAAAPVADPPRQRLRNPVLLGDDVPSALNPPSGCRFHTRCPLAFDRCVAEVPQLLGIGDGSAACHLVRPDGTGPDIRNTDGPESNSRDRIGRDSNGRDSYGRDTHGSGG